MNADAARRAIPRAVQRCEVALLQAGELDYIWTYENLAENAGLRYVKLPRAVDLGEPADSAAYPLATTRVLGKRPGDTLTLRGRPILFGVTVPATARHPALAERFVAFLLSADGQRILRGQHFDALDRPVLAGTAPPAAVVAAIAAP